MVQQPGQSGRAGSPVCVGLYCISTSFTLSKMVGRGCRWSKMKRWEIFLKNFSKHKTICITFICFFRLKSFVSNMTDATVESLTKWLEMDIKLYTHFLQVHRSGLKGWFLMIFNIFRSQILTPPKISANAKFSCWVILCSPYWCFRILTEII